MSATSLDVGVEYPFSARPASEAAAQLHRVAADRPMTRVTMPFGGDVWVVHRNAAAREVLTDARFVREPFRTGRREVPYFVQFPAFLTTTLQFEDPPQHTKLRRLVQRAISPAAVKAMRESAADYADELLATMATKGHRANLVSEYALPLPIQMLSNLLGVPAGDRADFERWASSTLAVAGVAPEDIARDMADLHAYLASLIAARRARPREDLISSLARAQDSDESLADGEILTIAMLLLVAGFDNTANFITIGVSSLLHNPDQLAAFREDPAGLAASTVEEVLRHGRFSLGTPVAGIGGLVPFVATEEIEIDGVVIAEGEAILIDPASVNHDGVAADHDDRLDVTREQNPHLTLSYGLHHCLGAPLARMEMQVALERLFTRFPHLSLDGDPVVNANHLSRPIVELNVTW
ncbi:cytochrome [Microbacterium sp. Root166]|uniref:cytochrome P450 n=1 Tax=Microbacterium sp. Root166 TaxID=1736478 RepID=UPI000701639C|nr:cytochrome P450 [Microbacterium sp. Root166]KQZ85258.1 cytochrome [Microbacterium sp. Root166]